MSNIIDQIDGETVPDMKQMIEAHFTYKQMKCGKVE